jgi:hypothetical protein
LRIGADDPGGVGDVPWTRGYCPRHLDVCRIARGTPALVDEVIMIVRLLHLRSERSSLAQQQAGQKDDDEFHKTPR